MTGLDLRAEQPIRERWAVLSDDGRYRYVLGRRWGFDGRRLAWIMLNPSTADATVDDMTVTKCIGFSQRDGFDELVIVNLYAYRATDPKELGSVDDPFGDNGEYLGEHVDDLGVPVVAAWGAHRWASRLADGLFDRPLLCLGVTADGSPRHPSRTPYSAILQPWPVPRRPAAGR